MHNHFLDRGLKNATIYVSTPLWFTLATGLPSQTLFEIPIQRPSDTWFGFSTQEGETCYASRSYGRLDLENLTLYPHRLMILRRGSYYVQVVATENQGVST